MKISKKIFATIAACALLASCDSIEDTYNEFAGDGPIRYAGRCTDVSVKPGWECLRVEWKISDDPTVKHIVVKCWADGDTIRQELPPDATTTKIEGLENKLYSVTVQSLAGDGALSLSDNYTERPYTYQHETVLAFSRGFKKAYIVADHLLLFMSAWEDYMLDYSVNYTSTDGQPMSFRLDKDVFEGKYVDIPGIDTSKDITLSRHAIIPGCPDEIDFPAYTFANVISLNSDFKRNILERYGVSDDNVESFINTAEEICLDHDLYTFEDLLYFPRLKKVILGANHYYNKKYNLPKLEETESGEWILAKLHEILGTTVEVYSNCYLPKTLETPYLTRMGDAKLPELNYLDSRQWTINNSMEDLNNETLSNLLDNDASTVWTSWPSSTGTREMTLTIDMKSVETVSGVKIVQAASSDSKNFQPNTIGVMYSENGSNYKPLTYVDENTIGTAQGEASLLRASTPVKARYMRIVVKDVTYQGQVKVALADVAVY